MFINPLLKLMGNKSDGVKLLNSNTKKAKTDNELSVGMKRKVVSKK
jgi:hypothetical protein